MVDFCIGQNTITGGWFFNYEKDLLCTGNYLDFVTTFPPIACPTNGPYTIIITRYPGLTPSGTNAYNSVYWYVTAAEVRSK